MYDIEWLKSLIKNMEYIAPYIAPGFLFVGSFMWICQKKFRSPIVLLVASTVASFYVWALLESFVVSDTSSVSTIILSLVCCIGGLLAGRIYRTVTFNKVLSFFRIDRTTNDSIIEDVAGKGAYIAFYDHEDQKYYSGWYRFSHEMNNTTYASIVQYRVWDKNKVLIEDHSRNSDRNFIFNLSNCRNIVMSSKDPFGGKNFSKQKNSCSKQKKCNAQKCNKKTGQK